MFSHTFVPQYLKYLVPLFLNTYHLTTSMFPSTYVFSIQAPLFCYANILQYLCSSIPKVPSNYVPLTYVSLYQCFLVPLFLKSLVPVFLNTYQQQCLCSPVPMFLLPRFPLPVFHSTFVLQYICSTPSMP